MIGRLLYRFAKRLFGSPLVRGELWFALFIATFIVVVGSLAVGMALWGLWLAWHWGLVVAIVIAIPILLALRRSIDQAMPL